MKNKIIIIVVITVCIVGWFCHEASPFFFNSWENIPNNKYISKIKIDGKRVRVRIPNENAIYNIVDMSVFNGFQKVYSFDDAVRIYGRPNNVTTLKGKTAYEYLNNNGRIEIVREIIGYDSKVWSLVAYPRGIDYRYLLSEEISKRVDSRNNESIIVIDTDESKLLMVIVIKGLRIDYLSW